MSQNLKIIVNNIDKYKGRLEVYENNEKILKTEAFIGRNGATKNKVEGDGKTPIGKYERGLCFGTHEEKEISINDYIKIDENMYWIDDIRSKYYNQMVDITKVKKDWKSAEHLIEYPRQYEYAIEIKTNKENIPCKGSAIFLHCSIENPTSGCVAIKKENMKLIFEKLKSIKNVKFEIM